jgi:hypothetical protein
MKYEYLRSVPVEDRPKMIPLWGREYFTHWQSLRWFLLLSIPSLGSTLWNLFALGRWKGPLFGLLVCQYLVAVGFVSMCSDMCSSNWGTHFRSSEPFRFWVGLSVIVFAYTLGMGAIWAVK